MYSSYGTRSYCIHATVYSSYMVVLQLVTAYNVGAGHRRLIFGGCICCQRHIYATLCIIRHYMALALRQAIQVYVTASSLPVHITVQESIHRYYYVISRASKLIMYAALTYDCYIIDDAAAHHRSPLFIIINNQQQQQHHITELY